MLGRATTTVLRRSLARSATTTTAAVASRSTTAAFAPVATTLPSTRSFSSAIEDSLSAKDAWQKSCYVQIDYTISEDATVYDAIQRFAAYDIGCLVTVDSEGACFVCIVCADVIWLCGRKKKTIPHCSLMCVFSVAVCGRLELKY